MNTGPRIVKGPTPLNRWRGHSKYRAVKTPVDGIVFDSKKEAAQYVVLKLKERCGLITDLEWHKSFDLPVVNLETGEIQVIARYECDFRFRTLDGALVVMDVKGVKTPAYILKRKLMQAIYGITIQEL